MSVATAEGRNQQRETERGKINNSSWYRDEIKQIYIYICIYGMLYSTLPSLTLEAALLALDGVDAQADEQQNGGHAAAGHAQQVAHLQRFCAHVQLLL